MPRRAHHRPAAAALVAAALLGACSSSGTTATPAGTSPGTRPGGSAATGTGAPAGTVPDLQDEASGAEPDVAACPPTGTVSPVGGGPTGSVPDEHAAAPVSGPYPVASPLAEKPLADGAALQEVLDDTLPQLGHSPGAMALVWVPGTGVWRGAAGQSDPRTGAAMDPAASFRIGSATKPFTAMAVLKLVDEGRLTLDDPVGRWFPDMPDGDKITVRQLANMTSGINTYTSGDAPAFIDRMTTGQGDARFTPDELVRWGLELPRVAAPGERFFYSNTATVMLQLIAEKVAGKPYAQVLQEKVLGPLALRNTSYPAIDQQTLPRPGIHGYFCTDGQVQDVTDWNTSWAAGAGNMISTLDDMAVWTYQLGTGMQVSPATWAAQQQFVPIGGGWGYGVGLADFGGWWGHNGGMPGYTTYAVYNPAKNVVLILDVNSNFDIPAAGGAVETPATVLFKAFDKAITATPQ